MEDDVVGDRGDFRGDDFRCQKELVVFQTASRYRLYAILRCNQLLQQSFNRCNITLHSPHPIANIGQVSLCHARLLRYRRINLWRSLTIMTESIRRNLG